MSGDDETLIIIGVLVIAAYAVSSLLDTANNAANSAENALNNLSNAAGNAMNTAADNVTAGPLQREAAQAGSALVNGVENSVTAVVSAIETLFMSTPNIP